MNNEICNCLDNNESFEWLVVLENAISKKAEQLANNISKGVFRKLPSQISIFVHITDLYKIVIRYINDNSYLTDEELTKLNKNLNDLLNINIYIK